MQRYLSDLREINLSEKERCAKITNLFSHFGDNAAIRHFFMKWKYQSQKLKTLEDVNEAGPVVEEVLDAQIELKNIAQFMRKEGYTESQIKQALDSAKDKNKELMMRVV